ncbi:MAG: alkaline phosphatase [Bacteroidetes bacterium]|nr:MAG: alkaline phosphatase [Bacteroidota bacterium]
MVMLRRITWTLMVSAWIFQSCGEMELIAPQGLEIHMDVDTIVFAAIGDFGRAGEPEEKVANLVKSWDPDFIITTGDNNYESGELNTIKRNISDYYGDYIYNFDAPEEYRCNGTAYKEQTNRFFPSPGNHDANNKDGLLPYLNFFTLPQGEEYYSFVWGPITFYSLNSVTENVEDQKQWLAEQLYLSESPFHIVYFHHSPFSSGPHGGTERMQWDYYGKQVDIVLSGHDHIYSRISKKGEEGLYYIVNGVGGKSLYNCDSNPLPEDEFDLFCCDADYGAIKATCINSKLVVEFYAVDQPEEPVDSIIIEK